MAMDNGDWTTVVDSKRERREKVISDRKAMEKAKAKAAAAADNVRLPKQGESGEIVKESVKTNSPGQDNKPKGKKKVKRQTVVSSAADMRELIIRIITNAPTDSLSLASITDNIQIATGHVWNKKFKSKYGTVKKFVLGYPADFHFNASKNVCLGKAPVVETKKATSTATPAQEKATTSRSEPIAQGRERPSKTPTKPKKSSCGFGTVVVLVGLFAILMSGATFVITHLESN